MLRIEEREKILKERERSSETQMMMEKNLSSAKYEAFCYGIYWVLQQIKGNGEIYASNTEERKFI